MKNLDELIDFLRNYFEGIDRIGMGLVPPEVIKIINPRETTQLLFIVKIDDDSRPAKIVSLMFEGSEFYCKIYPNFESVPCYVLKDGWLNENEFCAVIEDVRMYLNGNGTDVLRENGKFTQGIHENSPHADFRRFIHYLKSCEIDGVRIL